MKITKAEPQSGLDQLANLADKLEQDQLDDQEQETQSGPQEDPKATNAQLLGAAIAAGRTVFCLVTKLTSPDKILDDKTAQRLGGAWGPVLDKYGIDLNAYVGDYALEIGAAYLTFEIVQALRVAVQDEIRSKAAKPIFDENNSETTS